MKFTISIPCYNSEKWVRTAVESALRQDYQNLEVIAVDNESTDSTYEILIEIQKQYPQLILHTAPNIYRHSWDEARELSFEIYTGDYITFMCSDDYVESNYVSNMAKVLEKANGKIKAIQSPIRNIRNGTSEGLQTHSYKSLEELKNNLLYRSPVNTPTVFYSRDLQENGLLKTNPQKYFGAADYDMYCNLVHNNVFIYPFPNWIGYNYRWHEEQCTWGMHKEPVKYDKLIQEYWREKWISK